MAGPEEVTDGTFDALVLKSDLPAAVLFKSPDCPFCVKMTPVFADVAQQFAGRLKSFTLDVSKGIDTAVKYGVMSVPRMLIFRNGKKVGDIAGWAQKERVASVVETALK
jgi:thioredoxin 1